jgi:hypothetical protein
MAGIIFRLKKQFTEYRKICRYFSGIFPGKVQMPLALLYAG